MGLLRTQHSLEVQLDQSFQWIVVDGNSYDQSVDILSDRVDHLVCEDDGGIYYAMNKGLKLSRGSHVLFLNSGDELFDETIVGKLKNGCKEFDVSYSDIIITDGEKIYRYWKAGIYSIIKILFGWHPPHPGFVFNNKYYLNGYFNFDTQYRIAADYAFMVDLMLKKDILVNYLPIVTTKMEVGGISNSSLSNIFYSNIECLRFWKNKSWCVPFWIIATKPLIKLPQFLFTKISK